MSREDLARRAVAAAVRLGLDWSLGMAFIDTHGRRWTAVEYEGRIAFINGRRVLKTGPLAVDGEWLLNLDWLLDLDDPATLGCIEHGMLPAAWPNRVIKVVRHITGHAEVWVRSRDDALTVWYSGFADSVGEALVACLEAAAERREP